MHKVNNHLLEQLLKDSFPFIKKAKNIEIILVIGNTGAGKSTIVNYLIGNTIVKRKKDNVNNNNNKYFEDSGSEEDDDDDEDDDDYCYDVNKDELQDDHYPVI